MRDEKRWPSLAQLVSQLQLNTPQKPSAYFGALPEELYLAEKRKSEWGSKRRDHALIARRRTLLRRVAHDLQRRRTEPPPVRHSPIDADESWVAAVKEYFHPLCALIDRRKFRRNGFKDLVGQFKRIQLQSFDSGATTLLYLPIYHHDRQRPDFMRTMPALNELLPSKVGRKRSSINDAIEAMLTIHRQMTVARVCEKLHKCGVEVPHTDLWKKEQQSSSQRISYYTWPEAYANPELKGAIHTRISKVRARVKRLIRGE